MMEIEILRDHEGRVQEFRCQGEPSGEELSEGKVVEIGVSTLMRTAIIGLHEYLRLSPEVEDEPDRLVIRLKRDYLLNREIDAILETMLLGLKAIEKRHPDALDVKDEPSRVKV
jgi:uncharacterized protein YsxB (DUF464 family)